MHVREQTDWQGHAGQWVQDLMVVVHDEPLPRHRQNTAIKATVCRVR